MTLMAAFRFWPVVFLLLTYIRGRKLFCFLPPRPPAIDSKGTSAGSTTGGLSAHRKGTHSTCFSSHCWQVSPSSSSHTSPFTPSSPFIWCPSIYSVQPCVKLHAPLNGVQLHPHKPSAGIYFLEMIHFGIQHPSL